LFEHEVRVNVSVCPLRYRMLLKWIKYAINCITRPPLLRPKNKMSSFLLTVDFATSVRAGQKRKLETDLRYSKFNLTPGVKRFDQA